MGRALWVGFAVSMMTLLGWDSWSERTERAQARQVIAQPGEAHVMDGTGPLPPPRP